MHQSPKFTCDPFPVCAGMNRMKYIVKKLQSRLAILRRLLVAFTTIATIHAQSITLKDTKGRAIEILIDSASETEVAGRRKGDNKKVSIKTETLDAESRKAVETWRKTTGRIPSQQFEVKLKHGDNHEFTVKFKMPVANYNTSIDHSSMINGGLFLSVRMLEFRRSG